MKISTQDITGLVLAGGRGARMGGVDKGLQPFDGLPLARHAARRIAPQVGAMGFNANRNLATYEAFGAPVWPDADSAQAGPLAGFLAGLVHCETPWLLTVPCDTPLFPLDLARRMADALAAAEGEIAVACAPEADAHGAAVWRPQPVFCLLSTALRDSLAHFIAQGGRKIDAWTAGHRTVQVRFDAPGAFANANTLAELHALEAGTPR
jgi:molybdopterin-guanine dinucleotide biosynthesis protein A